MASTAWMYLFALIGGALAAWRIWQNLNKLRQRQNDSWDARLIDQLRKRGSDPFKPHDVDFFLAFPSVEAAEQLAGQLRGEGFDADIVDEPIDSVDRVEQALQVSQKGFGFGRSLKPTLPTHEEWKPRRLRAVLQHHADGWLRNPERGSSGSDRTAATDSPDDLQLPKGQGHKFNL